MIPESQSSSTNMRKLVRKRLRHLSAGRILEFVFHIPVMIAKVENWWPLLLNYVGLRNQAGTYRFRNGIEVKTADGVDAVTVVVVAIKEDHGHIGDCSTVIDIGANIGVFSVFAAKSNKDVLVYAYEPMPSSYDLLQENVRRNHLEDRVISHRCAVCGESGTRRLYLGSGSPFHSLYAKGSGRNYLDVECVSLSDVFDENKIDVCDILKLDAEGAEFEILYQTPPSYLARIREIRLEYHNLNSARDNIGALTEFLKEHGFEITGVNQSTTTAGNMMLRNSDYRVSDDTAHSQQDDATGPKE